MGLLDIFNNKEIIKKQEKFFEDTHRDLKMILLDINKDFDKFKNDMIVAVKDEINPLRKRLDEFHGLNISVNRRLCDLEKPKKIKLSESIKAVYENDVKSAEITFHGPHPLKNSQFILQILSRQIEMRPEELLNKVLSAHPLSNMSLSKLKARLYYLKSVEKVRFGKGKGTFAIRRK